MKIENQVCSLEQAKRLEELGITSKSLFYWIPWKAIDFDGVFIGQECDKGFVHILNGEVETLGAGECFPAFTAAELGVMLPEEIDHPHNEHSSYYISYGFSDTPEGGIKGRAICWYEDNDLAPHLETLKITSGETEAQCRAKMLIELLESKLITPEEVNKRLTEF